MNDILTLDDLKPQKKLSDKKLETKLQKDKSLAINLNVPEIPIGKPIDKFLDSLPPEERKIVQKKIVTKALESISDKAKASINDPKLRKEIMVKSNARIAPQCSICSSIYYAIYLEWQTNEHRTANECSKLAKIAFDEEICVNSFYNHQLYHLKDKDWDRRLRRLMVLQEPTVDPRKITVGMVQLLAEEIAGGPDEDINLKASKLLKEFLKVDVEYEKIDSKTPVIDNSKINITQINQGGNIPLAQDTQHMLTNELSDTEKRRLEQLQKKWESKGTSKIVSIIPTNIPVVDPAKKASKGNIIHINEE